MSPFTVFIPGIPKPGGSKKGFVNPKNGRVIIVDACAKNKEWRSTVSLFAFQAFKGDLFQGVPLELRITFIMPRPKYHYNSKGLKPDAAEYHISSPDSTKLCRSAEDSLKGIVWKDDCLVAVQHIRKIYGEKPGAQITVTQL